MTNGNLDAKFWLQIAVLVLGFTVQYVTVKNDVDWIKQTLLRHEKTLDNVLAKER